MKVRPHTTQLSAPSSVPVVSHSPCPLRVFHAPDDGGGAGGGDGGKGGGDGKGDGGSGGSGGSGTGAGGGGGMVQLPPAVFNQMWGQGFMQPPKPDDGGDGGKGGDKGKGGDGGGNKPDPAADGGEGGGDAPDIASHPQYVAMTQQLSAYDTVLGGLLDQLEAGLPAPVRELVKKQSTVGEGDQATINQLARAQAVNTALVMRGAAGGSVDTGRGSGSGPGSASDGGGDNERKGPLSVKDTAALAERRWKELQEGS